MELLQKLQDDMKAALKAGEKQKLSVIRMLLSDVKNIDLAPKPTTAEEVVRMTKDEEVAVGADATAGGK